MIKAVECIGNLINICTDFMRSFFLKCTLDHASKSTELKHQVFLTAVRCRKYLTCFKVSACFHITVQDGFDTNDCIKDVRTCISLERGEAVYIKNIILGSLIGKIAIFNCCQTYNLSSISCIFITDTSVLYDLCEHFLINIGNQVLKAHNTALSCFERFAIFSIHSTEAKEGKPCVFFHKTGLSCAAEDLDKMKLLTFVNNVKDLIWLEQLHTLYNCGKVCSSIKRCSI